MEEQYEETIQIFLEENNFIELNEVQKKVFGPLLKGESLFVLAQTGSGKTLAYTLPLCLSLKEEEKEKNQRFERPRAVILVPTRELAAQVTETLKKITHHVKLVVRDLSTWSHKSRVEADIIVTTPGLLTKFQQVKLINLEEMRIAILDEFDQLLDPTFRGDMNFLFQNMPAESMQFALFSATFSKSSEEDVDRWFGEGRLNKITFKNVHQHQVKVDTFNINLSENEKVPMLANFLKKQGKGRGIIFVNKKADAANLYEHLKTIEKGRGVYHVHGDMNHKTRKDSLKKFKQSKGILVATDIAARGVHISGLKWVLNYDLPFEAVYYLHRAGRCGREGETGIVYNFVVPRDTGLIKRINEILSNQNSLKISPISTPVNRKKKSTKKKSTVSAGVSKKKKKTNRAGSKKTPRFARKKK